jgi:phosphatidylglycerol lysyltransferase
MLNRLSRYIIPAISLLLFTFALVALFRMLRHYSYHDVVKHIESLPSSRVICAVLLASASYFTLTGYDFLGLIYISKTIAYRRIALASFISYAFSNTIGLSFLTGGSVRYRLYSSWNLSAIEVAKLLVFCSSTLWIGFMTIAGISFTIWPRALLPSMHLPVQSLRLLGILFLVAVAAYITVCALYRKSFRLGEQELCLPSLPLALAQVFLGSMDWLLAGSVLFVLLPGTVHMPLGEFFTDFLLAQVGGVASQVPGGLGVFETASMLLLSPPFPPSEIIGSLLAFRGIYYLLPLVVAIAAFGIQETLTRREEMKKIVTAFSQWVPLMTPYILSFTTFLAGAILLISGALPVDRPHFRWLLKLLPLPVIEISHFLGSLIGAGLLILAWGLLRRLDISYHLSVFLLAAGIVFSLLRGANVQEAVILGIMLGALIPSRNSFHRKASFFSEFLTFQWIAAIILVLCCAFWLAFFSHKHVDYSQVTWWSFSIKGDAPRFLRATVGVLSLLIILALIRLFRPSSAEPSPPSRKELEKVRSIVFSSPLTYPQIALLGDKRFLFSESSKAFIMFGTQGRSWIALGDPVGPEEEWEDLIWSFRELVDRHDGWTVFYDIHKDNLHYYLDLGLTLIKVGEEGSVPLESFTLEGGSRKKFRNVINKMTKEGCQFSLIRGEEVRQSMEALKRVSDSWLQQKNTRERKFTMGNFCEDYLLNFPVAIVKKDDEIVAFANVWMSGNREELSIDLMRYIPDRAPDETMEYLFLQLMLWGRDEGCGSFNLGMASLSGMEAHSLAPAWSRLGSFVFHHGEHFYNFQGLRQYKEKFSPVWTPKYLAYPGGIILPRILADTAGLTAGGVKGIFTK